MSEAVGDSTVTARYNRDGPVFGPDSDCSQAERMRMTHNTDFCLVQILAYRTLAV